MSQAQQHACRLLQPEHSRPSPYTPSPGGCKHLHPGGSSQLCFYSSPPLLASGLVSPERWHVCCPGALISSAFLPDTSSSTPLLNSFYFNPEHSDKQVKIPQ